MNEPRSEEPEPEPRPGLELSLQNPNRYPEARRALLAPWLTALLGELAPESRSFAVRFVGERTMRDINRRYRGIDRSTDVLSFPGDEGPEGRHLGDVVISVPSARHQAGERGHASEHEVRLLLIHGVLHCLGYDHEADDGEMELRERELRRRWLEET